MSASNGLLLHGALGNPTRLKILAGDWLDSRNLRVEEQMKSMFRAVVLIVLTSVAMFSVSAWSAQQSTAKQLTVNDLAAKPDGYIGKVTVIGRVAAATPGKGFTLIDNSKCSTCTTDCLTDKNTKKIPFVWSGAAPAVKGVVVVQGILAKTAKGFTFNAEKVARQ